MNRGVPPTLRKARTGLFTPPGVTAFARANSRSDCVVLGGNGTSVGTLLGGVVMPPNLPETQEEVRPPPA
ncbi:hypothetical protein GCM10017782_00580 [Deinococcus ficus]|nr:hypothetical protein GCM10017782_00580 [Deinococcus ficus]